MSDLALAHLSIPPPPPPRPLDWRRARDLVRGIIAEPERTERVFELFEALGGRGDEPLFARFARSAAGAALLREQPSLVAALADRAALAALPEGSLGRAYHAFTGERGLAAEELVRINRSVFGSDDAAPDPQRDWFFARLTAMHDLWHVLTGYATDEAGEAALLAFSMAQGIANRGVRLLVAVAAARAPKSGAFAFQRFLVAAWRRGGRSGFLAGARYEALLAQPLGEVRRALRIPAFAAAHPRGPIAFPAGTIAGRRP